jgi:hypothetical protein
LAVNEITFTSTMIIQSTLTPSSIDKSAGTAVGRFRQDGATSIVCSRIRFIEMISGSNVSILCQPVAQVQQLATLPCKTSDKLLMLTADGNLSVMDFNGQVNKFTIFHTISLYSPNSWTKSQTLGHLHRLSVSPCARFVAVSIAGCQVPHSPSRSFGSLIFTLRAEDKDAGTSDGSTFLHAPDVYNGLDLDEIDTSTQHNAKLQLLDEKLKGEAESSQSVYRIAYACSDHGILLSHPSIGLRPRVSSYLEEENVNLDPLGSGLWMGDKEWRQSASDSSKPCSIDDHWNGFIIRGKTSECNESRPGLVMGLAFTTVESKGTVLLALTRR